MITKHEGFFSTWLELIESEGGLAVFNKHVYDKYPKHFGPSGSDIRRGAQEVVNNWKRRTPESYLLLLRKHNVIPFSDRRVAPADTPIVASTTTSMKKAVSALEKEAKTAIDELSSDMEGITIDGSKPKTTVWPPKGSAWTPPRANEKGMKITTPTAPVGFYGGSLTQQLPTTMSRATTPNEVYSPGPSFVPPSTVYGSSVNSFGSPSYNSTVPNHSYFVPQRPLLTEHVEGSKSAPHPVFINMEHTHYNGIFDIVFDHNRQIGENATYSVLECRVEINEVDEQYYDMYIPANGEVPMEYDGKCLVVKTPTRTANHRYEDSFDEAIDIKGRETTKAQWEQKAIDPRSDAFFEWYILVFPDDQDLHFDNFIISGSDSIVKKDLCLVQFSHTDADFKMLIDEAQNNCSVVWTIATGKARGRGMPTSARKKKKRHVRNSQNEEAP